MVVVTRNDLRPGSQNAQSIHAVSQFFLEHSELAKHWNNQYIVSLSEKSEHKLQALYLKLLDTGTPVSYFTEPDLGDQLTSICFPASAETEELTRNLPLLLSNH